MGNWRMLVIDFRMWKILDYSFHCLDADQGVDGHEITEKIRKRLNENQKKTEGTKNH